MVRLVCRPPADLDDCVEMVRHENEGMKLQLGVFPRELPPQSLDLLTEGVQDDPITDNRAKERLVPRDLKGHEEQSARIIDIRVAKRLAEISHTRSIPDAPPPRNPTTPSESGHDGVEAGY